MVVLKVLSLVAAMLVSLLAVSLLMRNAEPVRVRANRPNQRQPQMRRLRQDPRTGIYYPEA